MQSDTSPLNSSFKWRHAMPQTIDEVVGEKQEFWHILETEESHTLSTAILLLLVAHFATCLFHSRKWRQVQC